MRENILQVQNLFFSYEEEHPVISDLSLHIGKGEKIAVLGANGAGKSTFFLNLNGVREPDRGEIILHGEKIERKTRNKLRKSIGIVFQDADSQMIASTVKAEIAFGPLNMGLSRAEVEKRTKREIERLALGALEDRPPHYLSGGEKKRVSIADILAMDSEIIIFDEPTASLDPVHTEILEHILEELEGEEKTILLSTHDVDFAYRFADRVLILAEGKLKADGSAADIFSREDLLSGANLKKPMLLQFYDLLSEKNLISNRGEYPKTLGELERLMSIQDHL